MKEKQLLLLYFLLWICSCELAVDNSLHDPERERQILFISDRDSYRPQIFLMNSDGSNQRKITNDNVHYGYAVFSPDDSQILILGDPVGMNYHIFVMNRNGSDFDQLTFGESNNYCASYQKFISD